MLPWVLISQPGHPTTYGYGKVPTSFLQIPLNITQPESISPVFNQQSWSTHPQSLTLGFAHSRGTVHSQHINESEVRNVARLKALMAWVHGGCATNIALMLSGFSFLYSFFIMRCLRHVKAALGASWFVCLLLASQCNL